MVKMHLQKPAVKPKTWLHDTPNGTGHKKMLKASHHKEVEIETCTQRTRQLLVHLTTACGNMKTPLFLALL